MIWLAVDGHPGAVEHLPDGLPTPWQVGARRERRRERVVVAAGKDPRVRVHAERRGGITHAGRDVERVPPYVDRDGARRRDVTKVGEQPVGYVDHGGRP